MTTPEERVAELGLTIPEVPKPVAAYVPAVRSGSYVYTSGQLPMRDGALIATGKVGGEVTAEVATECAQQCALNAHCRREEHRRGPVAGRARRQARRIRRQHARLHRPARCRERRSSHLVGNVFGEAGQHARSAVGAPALPLDAPVEVEMIVEVR